MLGTTTEEGSHLNKQSKFLLKKIIFLSSQLLPEVPHFSSLIQIATDFSSLNQQVTRTRATKLVKELSSVALKNPLEYTQLNEVMSTAMSGSPLGPRDFSPLFMRFLEYFVTNKIGLNCYNTVISNNQNDLKQLYYQDIDELKY